MQQRPSVGCMLIAAEKSEKKESGGKKQTKHGRKHGRERESTARAACGGAGVRRAARGASYSCHARTSNEIKVSRDESAARNGVSAQCASRLAELADKLPTARRGERHSSTLLSKLGSEEC